MGKAEYPLPLREPLRPEVEARVRDSVAMTPLRPCDACGKWLVFDLSELPTESKERKRMTGRISRLSGMLFVTRTVLVDDLRVCPTCEAVRSGRVKDKSDIDMLFTKVRGPESRMRHVPNSSAPVTITTLKADGKRALKGL